MAEAQELMTEKYGTPLPYDKNFKGPSWRNRSCTDLPCLFIFLIFLGAWGWIAYYAINHGDLNQIATPTDSYNRKCGLDSKVTNKPYLFFFDLDKCVDPLVTLTGCDTPQVCVDKCPTETFDWDEIKKRNFNLNDVKRRLICKYDVDLNNIISPQNIDQLIREERCARFYAPTKIFLNRCIWDWSKDLCKLLNRNRRHLDYNMTTNVEAYALPYTANSPAKVKMSERMLDCSQASADKESPVEKKMMESNSTLVKLITNIVARFYHDPKVVQKMGDDIVEDLYASFNIIMTALFLTLIAALLFIACLRWLAGPVLWLSIISTLIGIILAIFYTIKQYQFFRDNAIGTYHDLNIQAAVQNFLQDKNTWLYLTCFLCLCFIVIFLLVIVLRNRIRIAIALTKEGSKAVSCVKSTVFYPIFSWILYICAISYALAIGLYLGSIGTPTFRMIKQWNTTHGVSTENCYCDASVNYTLGGSCIPSKFDQLCFIENTRRPCVDTSCSFVELKNPSHVTWFIGYNIFGFFWLMFFISGFSDMVLAATFATWYWTFKKREVPFFTLTRAFAQCSFYHLGTVAFGALILTICRIIRVILEYINSKLKKFDNSVTRAIMCCCRCFFWLLETFLRFLNRNAYIMCAIHGKNFCSSSKDAFNLIMRNFLRTFALDKVTDFIFFLSKVVLTGAAGAATYFYCVKNQDIHLHYYAVPTTIVVIFSFLITTVFFDVYGMAVDTLFLCFLEDCERNDGTTEKPYYMSKQLMRILGKRNQRPKSNPKRK